MKKIFKTTVFTLLLLSAAACVQAQDVMVDGKKLFSQVVPACSICHTLSHAGSAGEVGPSLDELKPDAARVAKALRNGIGQMPAFKTLTDAEVTLLSNYVAAATGAGK